MAASRLRRSFSQKASSTVCSSGTHSRERSWHERNASSRRARRGSPSAAAGRTQRSIAASTCICWKPCLEKVAHRTSSTSVLRVSLATWPTIPPSVGSRPRAFFPPPSKPPASNDTLRAKMRCRSIWMDAVPPPPPADAASLTASCCSSGVIGGNGPCGSIGLSGSEGKREAATRCIALSSATSVRTSGVTPFGGGQLSQSVACTRRERWRERACACISTKRCSSESAAARKSAVSAAESKPSAAPARPCGASSCRSASGTSATPPAAICRQQPAQSSTARGARRGASAFVSMQRTAACRRCTRWSAIPSARVRSCSQSGASSGATSERASRTHSEAVPPTARSSACREPEGASPSGSGDAISSTAPERRSPSRASCCSTDRRASPSASRVARSCSLAAGSSSCSGAMASSSSPHPSSSSSDGTASSLISCRTASSSAPHTSPTHSASIPSLRSREASPPPPSPPRSPAGLTSCALSRQWHTRWWCRRLWRTSCRRGSRLRWANTSSRARGCSCRRRAAAGCS
mmetsp:Transcript_448/g.1453  ORF Transcript_448/g.1453 Transcript_448/m.1453 type:complete len:523 (-) Transcript_448:498-2066(-)